MRPLALFALFSLLLAPPTVAAPPTPGHEYLVSASPLTLGAPNGDVCVAVNPADPQGVWWWEPGQSGCSTRSTGPGVFHGEGASVSLSAGSGGVTEIRFRVGLIGPTGGAGRGPVLDVLLLLDDRTMRSAATGSKVSIIRRNDLEVPGFDGVPEGAATRGGQIPSNVMSALTAKFPHAKIGEWSKEKETGKLVYDIEFKQGGWKFQADISADGFIHNWEQQIAAADLPDAVVRAVNTTFPNAPLKEIMAVTDVTSGTEKLEGYEILVQRPYRRDVKITVAPDGKVLKGLAKEK